MEQYKQEFIEFLVTSGALKFGEFTLKSGRVAPYFISTGAFDDGAKMNKLGYFYAAALQDIGATFDTLFGPAYKGIPLAVAVAMSMERDFGMNVGYAYNRKEVKDYGDKGGLFVGKPMKKGDKIVIIDDVISQGTSKREAFHMLEGLGVLVEHIIIAVDRLESVAVGGKSAIALLKDEFNVRSSAIATIDEIFEHLYNREVEGAVYIADKQKQLIETYLETYGAT